MSTPNFNFPTISPNMTADVPRDINALSIAVDTELAKKYTKPVSGVPLADLAPTVRESINSSIKNADKASSAEAKAGTNDAKFMTPLRVNDVTGTLTSLQTTNKNNLVAAINETFTQVVNGKTTIAAAINDRGGSASGSDTFQQLADKIDGLVPKTSSGTAVPSSTTLAFSYRGSGAINRAFITVSGLSFRPKRIVLVTGNNIKYATEYTALFDATADNIRSYTISQDSYQNTSRNYRLDGTSAYVNATGFRLPIEDASAENYRWYAYE